MSRAPWDLWGKVCAWTFVLVHIVLIGGRDAALAQETITTASGEVLPAWRVEDMWADRQYVRMEYVSYWATPNDLPPLVTTSSIADFGVLGQPTTTVLSLREVDTDAIQGGRLTLGYWLDNSLTWGVESEFWIGGVSSEGTFSSSATTPVLARPFLNAQTNLQDAQLVAHPLVSGGIIEVEPRAEMYSMSALARRRWLRHPRGYLDFLCGYRFFRLRGSLGIHEAIYAPNQTFIVMDDFEAENDFHGADFGAIFGLQRGGFQVDVTSRLALGDMRQSVAVVGSTRFSDPAVTIDGGWLAAPSNVGHRSDHEFGIIPELGVRLAYVGWDAVRMHVGYSAIYLSSVVRTGDQIDTTVDPSQLAALPVVINGPGPAADRPEPRLADSSMWLHGITCGVEFAW